MRKNGEWCDYVFLDILSLNCTMRFQYLINDWVVLSERLGSQYIHMVWELEAVECLILLMFQILKWWIDASISGQQMPLLLKFWGDQ